MGCGTMGGALATAISKGEDNIAVSNRHKEKAMAFASAIGAKATDNKDIAKNAAFIVVCTKPSGVADLLEEIKDTVKSRTDDNFVIVSIAAGVKIKTFTDILGDVPVIRTMPNTPAQIGEGMTVYTVNDKVSDNQKAAFEKAFSKTGEIAELSENLIDAACAVSGCGPAFVYMFIEALADGGVKCGLKRDLALKLAAQTVKGSADMVSATGKHPGKLKDDVCSPGGSTIEGVLALEDGAFRGTVSDAVCAAFERTKELG